MTINYVPFESKSGFVSPGFSVDNSGNIEAGAIVGTTIDAQVTSLQTNLSVQTIDVQQIILNGLPFGGGSSNTAQIDGDLIVSEGSTPYLAIINGQVSISSRTLGSINNASIGLTTPAAGSFTTLTANSDVTLDPTSVGQIDNVAIGATTAQTGRFTSITLIDEATTASQVPTKRYVDGRISALAIALGA